MAKKRSSNANNQPEPPGDDRWCNPFQGLQIEGLAKPQEKTPPAPDRKPAAPKKPATKLNKEDLELLKAFADDTTALHSWAEQDSEDDADSGANAPMAKPGRKKLLTLAVERKGRGGKTVTIIRGLNDLPMTTQMELCAAIKNALGTGARFTETTLELQGDQRQRAAAWLETQNFQCRVL